MIAVAVSDDRFTDIFYWSYKAVMMTAECKRYAQDKSVRQRIFLIAKLVKGKGMQRCIPFVI
jgi:hypothetical protein